VSKRHFSLVLISFSFCRVTESGGRGLAVAPYAFVAVSMIVSALLVVFAACLTTLVIFPVDYCVVGANFAVQKVE
jgi:hypothetical protein